MVHVRTHKHTQHMEMDGSPSHSSIKKDDSISCHCCYKFAHCGQLWINWHIFFLLFKDRQIQQLFLPLHKSRDCFYTPPTETVPFIKQIYLEPSRRATEEEGKMSSSDYIFQLFSNV